MAINVPYLPVPEQTPVRSPIPEVRPTIVEEAFGAGIAREIGAGGRELAHIGDQIFQRAIALQELENQTAANDADNQFVRESAQIHAKFNSLEGTNAGPKALEKYSQNLSELREKIGTGLSNPMSRRLYDRATRGTLAREIVRGAGHSAAQMKRANSDSLTASVDLSMQGFSIDPNPETFNVRFQVVADKVRALGAIHGWSPAKVTGEMAKVLSRARIEQINGYEKAGEPLKAKEIFDTHKDQIHWSQQDTALNTVRLGMNQTGSRVVDNEVNADIEAGAVDEKVGLEERIKKARERAKELSDDPMFSDYAVQRVTATYNNWEKGRRDTTQRNKLTIDDIIVAADKKPRNLDELFAIGGAKAREAWKALPADKQKAFLKGMAVTPKDSWAETPERTERFYTLMGMEPDKLLDTNLSAEQLPPWQLSAVRARVKEIVKNNGDKDPRTDRTISDMAPELREAGILPKRDNEALYARFRGHLNQVLHQEEVNLKRPLKPEERQQIARRLLANIDVPTDRGAASQAFRSLFGWKQEATGALFNVEPSSADVERIKNLPYWDQKRIEPTTTNIQKYYFTEQYNKHFGKPK